MFWRFAFSSAKYVNPRSQTCHHSLNYNLNPCVVLENIHTLPSYGRFFSLNPQPLWKFQSSAIPSFAKFCFWTPSLLEFSLTFLGLVMDIFSNCTISISWILVNAIPLEGIILTILIHHCHVCTTDRSLGGFHSRKRTTIFLPLWEKLY